ncbi:2-phosphosulfolactate phosphatase [Sulfurimonas aquatica]|uniref:Probable 2-phosphosulfolactate phosphatase n=1 Tax=Sulfurimonas aquatica TaxID=2672570 RepID=A0A975AZ97_9BACT|nr:2-phosphosulfolactate phosphatase [Sulfurimonas aquatica]QSZ41238.1 2-phosphosulfolactate phosphatase [Sulfurimonas aquatica]
MKVNIIIDVLRAFTVSHIAFIKGVERIYLVANKSLAFGMKEKNPEYILCGEEHGLLIHGFDLDNSPTNIISKELSGEILVQKTTNGTKVTLDNLDADRIFVTGYSNSKTLVKYLHTININYLNIIPSRQKDDDLAVKDYIERLYKHKSLSTIDIIQRITDSDIAMKFFNDKRFNPKDIVYSTTNFDTNFIMEIKSDERNNVYIQKITMKDYY